MPLDDSLAWIPEASFDVMRVEKGKEGCLIIVEKLLDESR
jgi:hypothetical protein